MKRPEILFLVQLPPPVHGSSLANQLLVEDPVIQSHFQLDVFPIQMADNNTDMGKFSWKKIVKTFRQIFRLMGLLSKKKYDLAYITLSPFSFAFYKDALLVLVLKLFRQKIVFHLHGRGIKSQTQNFFKRQIYKQVFKGVEVIMLDELLYEDIQLIYPKTPYFLPNGIQASPRQPRFTENSIPTFIYLSNLTLSKGILDLVAAIKILQQQQLEFKTYIVGNSTTSLSTEDLQARIELDNLKNVVVTGPIYGEKKYDYLVESDVFVLPSKLTNESFPLSILEAFQAGLAVISTHIGAIPAIVENNVNGFTVEPENAEQLAEKMKCLIENPEVLQDMKQKNIKKYQTHYTREIFTQNFISIINNILSK